MMYEEVKPTRSRERVSEGSRRAAPPNPSAVSELLDSWLKLESIFGAQTAPNAFGRELLRDIFADFPPFQNITNVK